MVSGMMPGFVVGLLVGLVVVCFAVVWYVLVIRRRHGGGVPLPAFLIRAENASPALRELVARMARSSAKDVLAEWDTLPPSIQTSILMEVRRIMADRKRSGEGSS